MRTNSRVLLAVVAIALVPASAIWLSRSSTAQHPEQPAAPTRELTVAGLRMSISVVSSEQVGNSPVFRVSIENAGKKDVVLNLGTMLANGTVQRPSAVRLVLMTTPQSRELHWRDSRAGAVGRVDDYVVPLRVGATYSMKLNLDNYWCPATKEWRMDLETENYRIYAKFEGKVAVSLNGDTEGINLMPFWKGQLRSKVATFSVTKGG